MSARVLVFGDSIAYGAWDPQGGWADRLKRDLHQQTKPDPNTALEQKFQLLNLGVGGQTSADIARRAPAEIAARHSASWPFVFLLAVGINDTRVPDGASEPEVDERSYLHNLGAIVKGFRHYSDRILLIGPAPIAQAVLPFKGIHVPSIPH